MKKSLKKSERLEIFFRYMRRKHPYFKKAKEVYDFLSTLLVNIETKYCRSIDEMIMNPFNTFTFSKKRNVYYWKANEHIVFINKNGSFAIYKLKQTFKHAHTRIWNFYITQTPLILSLNPIDQTIW